MLHELQHTPAQDGATPRRGLLHRLIAVGILGLAVTFAGPVAAQADPGDESSGLVLNQDEDLYQTAAGKQAYKTHALNRLGGNTGQFGCLDRLWERESGWNPRAQNPRSSAYGIPQLVNATWASTGIAKTSNPYRQVDAGLAYIRHRYGSSCQAWQFHRAHHWY